MSAILDLERERMKVLTEADDLQEALAECLAGGTGEEVYRETEEKLIAARRRAEALGRAIAIRAEAESEAAQRREREARAAEHRRAWLAKARHDLYRARFRQAELRLEAARLRQDAELKEREAAMYGDPSLLSQITTQLQEAGVTLAEPAACMSIAEHRQELTRWHRLVREAGRAAIETPVVG